VGSLYWPFGCLCAVSLMTDGRYLWQRCVRRGEAGSAHGGGSTEAEGAMEG
jgi:hypothetical protein